MSEQSQPLETQLETTHREMERHEHDRREERDVVVIDDGTHLSSDQRRTAHELRRLYQSLCGTQPGQYWPQALLDTAGRFNRPAFPDRPHGRK